MKLISSFKDYYDYLIHQYGSDPKVVYNRRPLVQENEYGRHLPFCVPFKLGFIDSSMLQHSRFDPDAANIFILVIAGKPFYVEKVDGKFKISEAAVRREREVKQYFSYRMSKKEETDYISLSKKVGAPVFMIINQRSRDEVVIDSMVPVLRNTDIPSVYPAQQIYQDISNFIQNVLCDSPDLDIPNNQTDKEKVLQHGFDLKQSFRHRK